MDPKKQFGWLVLVVTLCPALVARGQTGPQQQGKPAQSVPSAKTKRKPSPRIITNLSGFELTDPEKLEKQIVVAAGTRHPGEPPDVLAPMLGKVYSRSPVFAWQYAGPVGKTQIILRDNQGAQVFRGPVDRAQPSYMLQGIALKDGATYSWTIEVVPAWGPQLDSEPAGFIVVTSEERDRIDAALAGITASNPYQKALERARLFTKFRLWYDAVAAYSDLIASYPDRPELCEERGMIYAQIRPTRDLADEDFARADELRDQAAAKD